MTRSLNLEERTRRLRKRKKMSRKRVRMRKMAEQTRQMRIKTMVRGRARRKMERKRKRGRRKRAMTMRPSSITFSGRQGHYQMIEGSSYNSSCRFFLVKSNNAENVSLAKVTVAICVFKIDILPFHDLFEKHQLLIDF